MSSANSGIFVSIFMNASSKFSNAGEFGFFDNFLAFVEIIFQAVFSPIPGIAANWC